MLSLPTLTLIKVATLVFFLFLGVRADKNYTFRRRNKTTKYPLPTRRPLPARLLALRLWEKYEPPSQEEFELKKSVLDYLISEEPVKIEDEALHEELEKHKYDSIILKDYGRSSNKLPKILKESDRFVINYQFSSKIIRSFYKMGHTSPHTRICPRHGKHLKLLILVASRTSNYAERNAIRSTWGSKMRTKVSVAFFVGLLHTWEMKGIQNENVQRKDIIIGNFVDTKFNATLKTLSMLEWIIAKCPKVPYFFKTDDQTFLNIKNVMKLINELQKTNATNSMWGNLQHAMPARIKESKYYMPHLRFSKDVLPDFLKGPSYLMTNDIVRPLFYLALSQPYFMIEDLLVTGVLAEKMHIVLVNDDGFRDEKVKIINVQQVKSTYPVKPFEQFIYYDHMKL